ncbi:cupin [Nostoc sp. T09]|uniref:cupin domain-containing protein n=1 Tax=Nostoc sp. T09 TaxID=1932621 RepID=UPI000A388779|nr:cupin domain-containing protein [Nostoc sp. T09]OUL37832.1 cupin [Nostoc sp. T09]
MSSTITTDQSFVTQLREQIEYPHSGVLSKALLKDQVCQYTLFCLAANTEISEHTSTRNATINVVEGKGLLTLSGKNIVLEPGVLVFLPANAPHALQAEDNLTFLLILSEKAVEIN